MSLRKRDSISAVQSRISTIRHFTRLIHAQLEVPESLKQALFTTTLVLGVDHGFLLLPGAGEQPDLLITLEIGERELDAVVTDIKRAMTNAAFDEGIFVSGPHNPLLEMVKTLPGVPAFQDVAVAPIVSYEKKSIVGLLAAFAEADTNLDAESHQFVGLAGDMISLALENRKANDAHRLSQLHILSAKRVWEKTVDLLPQLIMVVDRGGCVLRANRTIEKWLSVDVKSITGQHHHDLFHPGCEDPECELRQRVLEVWPKLLEGDEADWEYRDEHLRRDFRLQIRGLQSNDPEDVWEEDGFATMAWEDITVDKRARDVLDRYNQRLEETVAEATALLTEANRSLKEQVAEHLRDKEALRESESRYATLVNTTQTGIYVAKQGCLVFCNQRFEQIFQRAKRDLIGAEVDELMYRVSASELCDIALGDGLMYGPEVVRGYKADGEEVWLSQSTAPIIDQGEQVVLGNVVDITHLLRVQNDLECSNQELEALYRRYLNVQESERKRVASDLHDGIGQTLSGIKFTLENAIGTIEKLIGRRCDRLHDVLRKLQVGIDEVRRTAMNLRPATLDHLGIVATLHWFCREFQSDVPGITVDHSVRVEEAWIPEPLKVVIFRIVQETFNNVAKHAKASAIKLELYMEAQSVVLLVSDNGIGMDLGRVSKEAGGLGLIGLRERAEHVEGRLTIDSEPDRGTTVGVVWPLCVDTATWDEADAPHSASSVE